MYKAGDAPFWQGTLLFGVTVPLHPNYPAVENDLNDPNIPPVGVESSALPPAAAVAAPQVDLRALINSPSFAAAAAASAAASAIPSRL